MAIIFDSMAVYPVFLKRLLDVVLSVIFLAIIFPVFILLLAVLFISNRGAPFFIQPRPGKNGIIFRLIKLRTMNNEHDLDGNLLPDVSRLLPIGKFLRSTSLDEIPQLLNVIKGDMSLVGPRPLLVKYLSRYSALQSRRHEVRPGITGWAQLNGRNSLSWKEKFEMDVWYVEHLNFKLDLLILVRTIKRFWLRNDHKLSGNVAMKEFLG